MAGIITERIDDGRYSLEAVAIDSSGGVSIYLGGGEKPHIGTVAVSQPRPSLSGDGTISCTTSVFNLLHHKDDKLAVPLAEMLCRALNQVVVVTAGIHIEQATSQEIMKFYENADMIGRKILGRLKRSQE
ncbi:MAG: hypothetical protein QHH10_07170 [Peptococcaceae bacterium]|jgi:hypothetical protein|nr:hypothetical protein [Peptococcaceae bacterium]MDH7525082.1 hypothetical protein [Peptococcaceae bacterium]